MDETKGIFRISSKKNKLDPILDNFKIIDTASDEFIGYVKVQINGGINDQANPGYILLLVYLGKGIGNIIANQLKDLAKTHSSLKKLFAIIDP